MPMAGDILMTARGTIGTGYVVKEGDKFYYKDGNVILLRARIPTNPSFILYSFQSSDVKEKIARLSGTTVVHLPITKANDLRVSFPGFDAQNETTLRLDTIREETQRLASIYERKLAELDALKKSLLHHAFSGQL
jgi:type I restriction enzyme S subunit